MKEEIRLPHIHSDSLTGQELADIMPDDNTISTVADAMKKLGDPSRLRIFWLLCHTEECVIDIAAIVNMTSPAVSHHLRLLKNAGLITSRRDGKEMFYKAADTKLSQALHLIIEQIADITCQGGQTQ